MVEFLYKLILFLHENLVYINMFIAVGIIFLQKKDPRSVWGWLIVLYVFPPIGFLFYILLGNDLRRKKIFRTKQIKEQYRNIIKEQKQRLVNKEIQQKNPELQDFDDLIYYNLKSTGAILTENNTVMHITDGSDKFEILLRDIREAKKYIHMQYYIIRNDLLFNRIIEELKYKVKEGVEVRILVDPLGSRFITKKKRKAFEKEGIKVEVFFRAILGRAHLRFNYRNHRKIVIIDGEIAYVGGFNIGKEYISMSKKFGYWRDTHMRIQGPAVLDLGIRFILDWNYARNENLFSQARYTSLATKVDGNSSLQVISSGPDSSLKNIRNNYLKLISSAKESICIQTPYFIPDEEIQTALIIALYSGVKVNIMVPCMPDHPFVYWATYSYVGELIMHGANCYVYENGFLHCKGIVVDDSVYSYGTANFDVRSFSINFEVNIVNYTHQDAIEMAEIFRGDLQYCRKITPNMYVSRSIWIKIKEKFSRLLSPIL